MLAAAAAALPCLLLARAPSSSQPGGAPGAVRELRLLDEALRSLAAVLDEDAAELCGHAEAVGAWAAGLPPCPNAADASVVQVTGTAGGGGCRGRGRGRGRGGGE